MGPRAARQPVLRGAVLLARRLSLLPDPYLFGFFPSSSTLGAPSFLLGERSEVGHWYYFPATFALKTPLGLVVLLALALATWRRHAVSARVACFLWLPVAVRLALTLTRSLYIGHRHLLPIYPFLFVAAGRCARLVRGWQPLSVAVVAAAAVCLGGARPCTTSRTSTRRRAGPPTATACWRTRTGLGSGPEAAAGVAARPRHRPREALVLRHCRSEYYHVPADLLPGYMLPRPRQEIRSVVPGDIVAVSATNLAAIYVEPDVRPLMALLRRAGSPSATWATRSSSTGPTSRGRERPAARAPREPGAGGRVGARGARAAGSRRASWAWLPSASPTRRGCAAVTAGSCSTATPRTRGRRSTWTCATRPFASAIGRQASHAWTRWRCVLRSRSSSATTRSGSVTSSGPRPVPACTA